MDTTSYKSYSLTVSDIIDDITSNVAKVRLLKRKAIKYTFAKLYNQGCFIDSFHKN